MALRVLLADESGTIKKVFQLALQDFAVEVQPVNMGLDVVNVAKRFKPDIVFADVLLQKKNGYDVSSDIKHDADLNKTPVVLMWSGFMELDEDKYQASQADGHLEKPFDVKALRTLINDLVPKTKNQKLSGFLNFPDMPEFAEQAPKKEKPAPPPPPPIPAPATTEKSAAKESWSMEDFEPPETATISPTADEAFKSVPLPSAKSKPQKPPEFEPEEFLAKDEDEDSNWQRHDIGRFQIEKDIESLENEDPVSFEAESQPDESEEAFGSTEIREIEFEDNGEELEVEEPLAQAPTTPIEALSPERLEAIVRAQSKEVIEAVVWKIVPEIATTIIERELKRLLDERDSSKNF